MRQCLLHGPQLSGQFPSMRILPTSALKQRSLGWIKSSFFVSLRKINFCLLLRLRFVSLRVFAAIIRKSNHILETKIDIILYTRASIERQVLWNILTVIQFNFFRLTYMQALLALILETLNTHTQVWRVAVLLKIFPLASIQHSPN